MPQTKVRVTVREPADGIAILDIQGEISAFAEEELMSAHATASSAGARSIILNFTGVESMNSAGAGLLIALLARVQRQKQRLLAYGLAESNQPALVLTRMNEVLGLYSDEAEAIGSVAL
jgi:anti-anti-sigma factor